MSKIEWTDQVWSPVRCHEHLLSIPLKRKKPTTWFVNAMSDMFHEGVPFEFIDRVFAVMAICSQHTFIVLTKRPERMEEYTSDGIARGYLVGKALDAIGAKYERSDFWSVSRGKDVEEMSYSWPLPNVILGTSIEDQRSADERIPWLLKCPAEARMVSAEPLLGPIDLSPWTYTNACGCTEIDVDPIPGDGCRCKHCKDTYAVCPLDWLICGGESGPSARPMNPDWARSIRDQCQAAAVPFFFKQWGEWCHYSAVGASGWARTSVSNVGLRGKINGGHLDGREFEARYLDEPHGRIGPCMVRVGKKAAGRLLDGRTWDEMPEDRR